MKRSSRPFFGILYLMVHVPFVVFWKIGITGIGVGTKKRAKQIGRDVIGFPFPVFFVPIPFCYDVEQWLHRTFNALNVEFYKGNGSKEFFWFPVVVFVIPIMLAIWAGYLFCIFIIFDFNILKFIEKYA